MVERIDGRVVAQLINQATKQRVEHLAQQGRTPGLAVLIVGENPASERYVRMKERQAQRLGIHSELYRFSATTTEAAIIKQINQLNENQKINAILVQAPLPGKLRFDRIIATIAPRKDVDGFHPVNVGKLFLNLPGNYPVACTPLGIMTLLAHYRIPLAGKQVVVIGRSAIVGKPLLALLLNANASVSILHQQTTNLRTYTKNADVVIVATGHSGTVTTADFKQGACVVDVGQNLDQDQHLIGDVAYDDELSQVGFLTPVPGGVGPMTIAMLMQQTVAMCEWEE